MTTEVSFLDHMYSDSHLYDVLASRTQEVVRKEAAELKAALTLCLTDLGTKGRDALELFCGAGSKYLPHLDNVIELQAQIDILKHPTTQPEVTIGDALTHNFERKFDVIYDPWENSELLPQFSEQALAANIARHLADDGFFLQCVWPGLADPIHGSCSVDLTFHLNKSSPLAVGLSNPIIKTTVHQTNDLVTCQIFYHHTRLLDGGSIVKRWDIREPVVLTGTSPYAYAQAFAELGFKARPIVIDESGNARWFEPLDLQPRFYAYFKP